MMSFSQIWASKIGVFGDMVNIRMTPRHLHTSPTSQGNKAKRRKLKMREMMPHIPVKKSTGVPTVQALHHFDQLYSSVFRNKWPSMRLGLMSPNKYAAIVNNAGDSEQTIEELKSLGCVDIHEQFKIGFSKVEPYITYEEDGGVSVDSEAVENLEDSEPEEEAEEAEKEIFKSLDPDEASSRLIKPDKNLLSGNSVTMYNFMPTAKLKGMEDFVEESHYYESYEKIDTNFIKFKPYPKLNFPDHLRCFTFPRSDLSHFPQPRSGSLGTLNYYCLDAASLFPVLALDVRPGHSVLDLCAAPGGKSLAILQTLYPSVLTCNDVEYKRVRRLIGILDQYCGKGDGIGDMRKCVNISRMCGTQLGDFGAYDRVLVDAPCYSDRHSVTSEEGNIFVKNEIKQRLKMPEKQSELLKNGLKHLAPGGSLVYSTCTLSPVQNDGVVHKVLTELWEETSLNFEVADLDLAVKPFKFMCKIFGKKEGLKYGQLITTIADSMVMSLESGAQEETGEVRTEDNREPELTRPKITDREKELAAEASASYNSGDFSGCLATLEKLEVMRPTDLVLAHNKIVVQCKDSQLGGQEGGGGGRQVALSDVVQQLEALARTIGVTLSGPRTEEDTEGTNAVLLYNLALARFQQRHVLQASQLAARLLPLSQSISPSFARKILFFQCELSLALHQPEQAMVHAQALDENLNETNKKQNGEVNIEQSRLFVLRARCNVMARLTKTLKKELKSVALPGTMGHTCEFVRAHIEALHNNHRKSIKMLNSVVQMAGNRVFPHYYNNLGCLHHIMKKPNLAVYYFKNALDRLDAQEAAGGGHTSWVAQSQVLYNIGISLLHARRPAVAYELLLEVVGAHYLDPHVWFHLAECCIMAHSPDTSNNEHAKEVSPGKPQFGVHKLITTNPASGGYNTNEPGTVASLSLEFAYICLKNAESLLPSTASQTEEQGVFCEGLGYIGNPITWAEVEQLRVAVITAKAFTALSLHDYIPALHYAEQLLTITPLAGCYNLLAHLYAAESLILQDRLSEAIGHLDPELVGAGSWEAGEGQSAAWHPASLDSAKQVVQYNLAVGFALRDEWDKASSLINQLYKENQDVSVQVLLLVLYVSIKQGNVDKARKIVQDRCPDVSKHGEKA